MHEIGALYQAVKTVDEIAKEHQIEQVKQIISGQDFQIRDIGY